MQIICSVKTCAKLSKYKHYIITRKDKLKIVAGSCEEHHDLVAKELSKEDLNETL